MGKKCCVYGCDTNYASAKKRKKEHNHEGENCDINISESKIAVYRFPKDEDERERWVKVIPNANLKVTNDTVICEEHWPKCFEKIKVYGKYRPKNAPSVWKGIPKSQSPSIPPPMRTTKRASSSVRVQEGGRICLVPRKG